jgi:hypothetical protein
VNGSVVLPKGIGYQRIADAAGRTVDGKWFYVEPEITRIRKAYELLFRDCFQLAEIERQVGWSRDRIRTLANPTWKGLRVYPPAEDGDQPLEVQLPLEPVLTPERWTLAQALLAKRRTWSKETRDQRFLGAGLLICECGRPYYVQPETRSGRYDYYFCSSKLYRPTCGACPLRRVFVDAIIEQLVSERLTNARFLTEAFARVEQPSPTALVEEREHALAKLTAQRKKWMDAYDEDCITKQEFAEKMDAVKKAVREVEARIPVVSKPSLDKRTVVAAVVDWAFGFAKIPDFATKRRELKRVIARIPVINTRISSFDVSGAFLHGSDCIKVAQPCSAS